MAMAPTGDALEPSGPIIIDGDADLAAQAAAHNWTGADRLADGSAERPFNITALSFDIPDGAAGILIRNTTFHLVIEGCEFINAAGPAVELHNVTNIVLNDNTFDGNYVGISLQYASRCVMFNNSIIGSVAGGIVAESCSNVTIVDNEIEADWRYMNYQFFGIYFYNIYEDYENGVDVIPSENNTVARNHITGYIENAINIEFSDRFVIEENVIEDLSNTAIILYGSNFNSVLNNTIEDVWGGGIIIYLGNANLIEGNDITGARGSSGFYGIEVAGEPAGSPVGLPGGGYEPWDAADNRVVNNTIGGDLEIGIAITVAKNNLVDRNTVYGGNATSIYLLYAVQNNVTGNLIENLVAPGIDLQYAESNTIAGNTIESLDGFGIHLENTYSNIISGNIIGPSEGYGSGDGISVWSGHEDLISGNTIARMGYGIYLWDSFARVYGNTIIDARWEGLSVSNCAADLQGNVLIDCEIRLYLYDGYESEGIADDLEILSNNTVNGRPVLFIKDSDMGGQSSPAGQGQIILLNVSRYIVSGQDMDHGGVYLLFSDNITVSGNSMANMSTGISMTYCEDCTIEDNVITAVLKGVNYAGAEGISTYVSSRCVIRHNEITMTAQGEGDDRYIDGIYASSIIQFTISGNTVNMISLGGQVYATAIYADDAHDCTIAGNHLSGTRSEFEGSGIYLSYSDMIGIYGNEIANMTYIGIDLGNTQNSVISGNHIAYCGYYAIRLETSDYNKIYGNWIEGNNWGPLSPGEHQAYDYRNTNEWNVSGYGNIWSDWTAPDADGDGIVDLPYSIVDGVSQDALPVVVTLSMTSPSSFPHYVKGPTVDISGVAQDVYGIVSVSWLVVESGANGTCTGTAEWSASIPLAPGENHVRITMVDEMGFRFVEERVIVCAPGPTIETIPDTQQYTNKSTMEVEIEVNDLAPIAGGNWTLLVDGVETARGSFDVDGMPFTWSLTRSWELSQGTNVIVIQMNNSVGGATVHRLTVVYDAIAPTVSIDAPASGELFATGDVSFTWTGSDSLSGILRYEVSIDGGAWTNATSGYTATGLADGLHSMRVRATDRAGNTAEAMVEFTVDTVAPVVAASSPSGNEVGTGSAISVTFSKAMDHSTVVITIDGVTGTVAWDGNTVTFTPSAPLAAGTTYSVTVTGSDLAGNTVEHSWEFTTGDLGEISGQIVDDNGSPLASATVRLENGMTTTTDLQGRFTFTGVPSGEHTLTVSKEGYADRTMTVTLAPGQTYGIGSLGVESATNGSSDGLLIAGAVVAVAAIAVLGVFLVRRKK
jgi:parallel beta-helix repeat protein